MTVDYNSLVNLSQECLNSRNELPFITFSKGLMCLGDAFMVSNLLSGNDWFVVIVLEAT
jgi:hypothetical protein